MSFNPIVHLAAKDCDARLESFTDILLQEIQSDEESYHKKGRQIFNALMQNDADSLLIALCGWSAASIAKKAMLIQDKGKEFYSEPVDAELIVHWTDGSESNCKCQVDPATFQVLGIDKDVFENDDVGVSIEEALVYSDFIGYSFSCVPAAEKKENMFWYALDGEGATETDTTVETKQKHISEVEIDEKIVYDGEIYTATSNAYLSKTDIGREWNINVQGGTLAYLYASYFEGGIVDVVCQTSEAKTTEASFQCDVNLKECADSMLYDSDTTIASMEYKNGEHVVQLDLMVRGAVKVRYEGMTYDKPSTFPPDLRTLIEKHPNTWDHAAECDDKKVQILETNWFEYIYQHIVDGEEVESDGIVCEEVLEEMSAEELKAAMIRECEKIVEN